MSDWDETLPYFLILWITCHFNITNNEFTGQHSRKLNLAFCVGSLEGASVELFSARKIKLTVRGGDLHYWVCDRSRVVPDLFLFSKMSENYRLGFKKKKFFRPDLLGKGSHSSRFSRVSPWFMTFKQFCPGVATKFGSGRQMVRDFS